MVSQWVDCLSEYLGVEREVLLIGMLVGIAIIRYTPRVVGAGARGVRHVWHRAFPAHTPGPVAAEVLAALDDPRPAWVGASGDRNDLHCGILKVAGVRLVMADGNITAITGGPEGRTDPPDCLRHISANDLPIIKGKALGIINGIKTTERLVLEELAVDAVATARLAGKPKTGPPPLMGRNLTAEEVYQVAGREKKAT